MRHLPALLTRLPSARAVALLAALGAAGPAPAQRLGLAQAQPSRPTPAAPPAATAAVPPVAPVPPFALVENPTGFTAQNISFALGPIRYSIPKAEIRGTSLKKDELASLLDPASAVPFGERARRLAAAEIAIPELLGELEGPAGRQTTTYRDIRVSNVASGRIASAVAGGGAFAGTSPSGPVAGTFARFEIAEIDLALAAALFDEPSRAAEEPLQKIYGSFAMEGLATRDTGGGSTLRIARIAGRDFMARRTRDGWGATFARLSAPDAFDDKLPEARARALGAFVDLLDAYDVGSIEGTGFEFADAAKGGSGRIARIAYAGGVDRPGEFRMDGLEAGSGDTGRVRVSSLSLAGFSVKPMLRAARDLSGRAPDELTPADLRRMVPTIGELRMSGLAFEGGPNAGDGPGSFAVGAFEFRADKPIEGVPTDLRLGIRNVTVPVDPAARDENMRQLADLGYARIDGSLTANLGWNEAGQEIVVREVSATSVDMGSVVMRAVLGNVTRDIFNPDAALASVALVGANAKSLDIAIENSGLFERILAREAKRQGKSAPDLRRDYGVMAAMGVPIMLGNSAGAKAIGQAVARFVAKPGRLLLQARAKDAAGVGVTDFAAGPDPTVLLEKFDVTAVAE